ncbi:hypothetical protein M3Y94_00255100 [Aphelenchoides besseyi]|nr:hypothetical protein M3Y94_00255100 [Aphelenchoides besseyi]
MADSAVRSHALVFRVMRLAKPKFYEATTMSVDSSDEFALDISTALQNYTGQESTEIPLTNYLLAPQSIDNIYLGETFTFYMTVSNSSDSDVCTNVTVQASIQTQTQKHILNSKYQDGNAQLEPQNSIGQVISHEIKETGQHILVCEVNYMLNNTESLSLRKFFKFPVEKPIDVRTKFFSTEDNLCEDVYLEAQIQNLCTSAITLERVDLHPSSFYKRKDSGVSCLSKTNKRSIQLNQHDIYQFLFCLSPNLADHSYAQFRGVSTIGNLDIRWRTQMGEPGRLQTSQLTRVAPSYGDLRLLVEKIPGQVQLKELFHVDCRVMNCSERSLDLILTLDNEKKRPFLFASPSGVHLGHVLPNTSAHFHLEVLALEKGVQFLSGIRITDAFLKRTYDFDDLAQVLVA